MRLRLSVALLLSLGTVVFSQIAFGPLRGTGNDRYAHMGWVSESGDLSVENNVFTIKGDSRAYLVQDSRQVSWGNHKYVRIDLQASPLEYMLGRNRKDGNRSSKKKRDYSTAQVIDPEEVDDDGVEL